ncbi:MAG: hypothetical protein KatS3mg105_2260 [Gemmatales bacterium]|nr:MAG: hypothetical protein KatS3mg105_2260 [Gemmatales bacterium]
MIDFKYLRLGISGMANSHKASILAGHLGAALVAGYFFGEEHGDLDDAVYRGIEKELDRILAGEEAIWFNAKKAGIAIADLFQPLPKGRSEKERIRVIADALERNIDKPRESGHNVIFASIAIRALTDHPEFATEAVVDGIRKLIAGFDRANPGRGYYGQEQGWLRGDKVKLPKNQKLPAYNDEQTLAEVVADELINHASKQRRGFGGLWHLINHAAGILELSRFGFKEIARQAIPSHRHHLALWRTLPDVEKEFGAVVPARHDPRDPAYWKDMLKRDQARLTHRIKTLYGFWTVARYLRSAAKKKQAEKALLYLMA